MVYSAQTWVDNNPAFPVSAARMAHIEDGITAAGTGKANSLSGAVQSAAVSNGTNQAGTINAELATLASLGGGALQLPAGTISHSATILLRPNVVIRGQGAFTTLAYTGAGTAVAQVTPGTRIFSAGLRDLAVTTSTGATGVDLQDISSGNCQNVSVSGFSGVGWRIRGTVGGNSVYNAFLNCTALSCGTGWTVEAVGSNSNRFYGCRAGACTTGVAITDSNQNVWMDGQIEVCTTGWTVTASLSGLSDGNVVGLTRFEGNTTNWNVASVNVRDTVILYPLAVDGTPSDSGTNTQVLDSRSQFLMQVRTSNATGSWRMVRTSNANSSEPGLYVADLASSAGTPLTIVAETARATGSFFRGVRAGTTFFDVKADGSTTMAGNLTHTGTKVGFNGTTPVVKPAVTGSRGGNAALASLLTQLASLGLITDSTSA